MQSQNLQNVSLFGTTWEITTPKSPISATTAPKNKYQTKKLLKASPRNLLVETTSSQLNIQKAIHKSKDKNFISQFKKRNQNRSQTVKKAHEESQTDKIAKSVSKNVFTILRILKEMCSQFRLICQDLKYFFSVQSTIWNVKIENVYKQMANNILKFDKLETTMNKFERVMEKKNFVRKGPTKQANSKYNIQRKSTFDTYDRTRLVTEQQKQTTRSQQTNCFMKISLVQSQKFESFSIDAQEHSQRTASNKISNSQKSQKMKKQLGIINQLISKMQNLAY